VVVLLPSVLEPVELPVPLSTPDCMTVFFSITEVTPALLDTPAAPLTSSASNLLSPLVSSLK
jgi:hypothetical protein